MTRFRHSGLTRDLARKESDMSMQFHRNVVIPVSFAVAIAMIVGPAVNAINGSSLLLLVLGLAVSTMIYALWRDSAGGGGAVAPRLDAERRQATRIWQPHDEHDVVNSPVSYFHVYPTYVWRCVPCRDPERHQQPGKCCRVTLGPRGRNVILGRPFGSLTIPPRTA